MDELFAKPARLLFYDIETAPLLTYIWSLRQKWHNLDMVVHDTFLLSWAAKWSDGKAVQSRVLSSDEAKAQDDTRIVEDLAGLIRRADYVVAHNGDRFDLPMLNGRLLKLGLDPLGKVQTIDTLKLARKSFRLASNKLEYLAQTLGFDGKHETDFELWKDCYHGKASALKVMSAYNRNDVVILEDVFHALMPYVDGLPRLYDSPEWRGEFCPFCGSKKRELAETPYRTKVNTFTKYRCSNCRREYRHWQAVGGKKSGSIGL